MCGPKPSIMDPGRWQSVPAALRKFEACMDTICILWAANLFWIKRISIFSMAYICFLIFGAPCVKIFIAT